jgi:hypothetical protein
MYYRGPDEALWQQRLEHARAHPGLTPEEQTLLELDEQADNDLVQVARRRTIALWRTVILCVASATVALAPLPVNWVLRSLGVLFLTLLALVSVRDAFYATRLLRSSPRAKQLPP